MPLPNLFTRDDQASPSSSSSPSSKSSSSPIVTGGGIVGNVMRIDREDNLLVEIAPDVRVKVMRSAISDVIRRPAPIGEDEDFEEEEEEEEEAERPEDEGRGKD